MDKNQVLAIMEQFKLDGGDWNGLMSGVQAFASTGKTSLGLNQWQKSDKPTMDDFNSDNKILDNNIRELQSSKANKADIYTKAQTESQLLNKAVKDSSLQTNLFAAFSNSSQNPNDGVTKENIFANPPLNKMAPFSVHQLTFSTDQSKEFKTPISSGGSEYWCILTFCFEPSRALQIAVQIFNIGNINGAIYLRTRHVDNNDYSIWQSWKKIAYTE